MLATIYIMCDKTHRHLHLVNVALPQSRLWTHFQTTLVYWSPRAAPSLLCSQVGVFSILVSSAFPFVPYTRAALGSAIEWCQKGGLSWSPEASRPLFIASHPPSLKTVCWNRCPDVDLDPLLHAFPSDSGMLFCGTTTKESQRLFFLWHCDSFVVVALVWLARGFLA